MSRRGRSGPAISLFAFQDIITSVTAVVIVVVLFLALDLVQRNESVEAGSPSGVLDDLSARITELQAELASLREENTQSDATAREAAQFSPSELAAEVNNAERAVLDLEARQKELLARHQLWQSKEKAALAERFDLHPLQLQLEIARQAQRDLQRQIEEGRNDRRPIYGLPRGVTTGGWVAVIESTVITVAPLGRRATPRQFTQTQLPLITGTAAGEFVRWVKKERLQGHYFLLLIRPGGAEQFGEVEEAFAAASMKFGFDVIDSQQEILHPEKGAAP